MAKKNSKRRYRREHNKNIWDYEQYKKKLAEKRERRNAKIGGRSLKEKVEERKEQMQSSRKDRGPIKSTRPVLRSKIKQDLLIEQFKEMKIERHSLMDRKDANIESMEEEHMSGDEEMRVEKVKHRKRGKAYRKMVKIALKRASKRPILIRKKMEVD